MLRTHTNPVSRRTALRQMVVGSVGLTGITSVAGFSIAQERSTDNHFVERQATGSEVYQVTTEQFPQSNIYCEVPYCSSDSKRFVYQRQNPNIPGGQTELVTVELGTWKQERLDTTTSLGGSAITHGGMLYYFKNSPSGEQDLMRADLADGRIDHVHQLEDGLRIRSLGTVTTDDRYYAGGAKIDDGWDMFDIALVDLERGTQQIIDRDPFILNPHPQFDPGETPRLMIQHNRGGEYSPDGTLKRLVGDQGATLYTLSVPDGKRTTLLVGKPYTTPCTGHEAWVGKTGEILLSVSASGDWAPRKGNLVGVREGQPARTVSGGYRFNHVGVSRCGRFFCCDDFKGSHKLVIGSIASGKSAVVCESHTSPNRSQSSHAHGYLTPDLRWVIFNSNRTGFAHIYAASVPEGMIARLSET